MKQFLETPLPYPDFDDMCPDEVGDFLAQLNDELVEVCFDFPVYLRHYVVEDIPSQSDFAVGEGFPAHFWTALVMRDWDERMAFSPEDKLKVQNTIRREFPEMADDMESGASHLMEIDLEPGCDYDIPYYEGLYRLSGWRALEAQCREYGLEAHLSLVHAEDDPSLFYFGISIQSPDGVTPIMEKIRQLGRRQTRISGKLEYLHS